MCCSTPLSTITDRVTCLSLRFSKAGLVKPTETAIKNLTCLAFLDKGPPEYQINNALAAGRTLKGKLLRRAKVCTAAGPAPVFDTHIATFERDHGEWYRDAYGEEVHAKILPQLIRNLQ